MSCLKVRVRAISLMLTVLLIAGFSAPVYAQEGEAQPDLVSAPGVSPDGVYAVVGTTSTGKQVAANVLVTSLENDRIQFRAKVLGIPVTTSGPATWNDDRTQATVPIGVYIFGLVDASGSIALTAGATGWDFTGTGSGTAVGTSGSATAAGFMSGGVAPQPELIAEATGVSQGVQSADSALSVIQPETTGDLDTSDAIAELAAILFAVFFMIIIQMILKTVIW